MDVQLVFFLGGCIVALMGLMYGALQWEIRKLRRQGHHHTNKMTEYSLALSMVCEKLGLPFRPKGPDE
jgi:membrane-anchored protein YejM (alkaline phosphatase superfamily)